MSVPRDLRDVLYPGITFNGVMLTDEMIRDILQRTAEYIKQKESATPHRSENGQRSDGSSRHNEQGEQSVNGDK